jgi:cytosine/adenosine deaminase-related metal-dependent hydrolase
MTTLIRGGLVLNSQTMQCEPADVTIEDGLITAIGRFEPRQGDRADNELEEIDAAGRMVAPGFVDTHRHTWQSAMRGIAAGWDLARYQYEFQMSEAPYFTPEDVYVGTLLGALAAIDSGITTLRDESHIQNSWAHTEAAVTALSESGIRACFGYGWPSSKEYMKGSVLPHPPEMERARADLLPDDDGLVTMYAHLRGPGMTSPELFKDDLARARHLGLRASIHAGAAPRPQNENGDVGWMYQENLLGDDITLVHCGRNTPAEFAMMAQSGTHASVTAALEAAMPGLGAPAYSAMMAAGLQPSLGIDVEVAVSGSMFDVMRAVVAAHQLRVSVEPGFADKYESPQPADLLKSATIAGARACGLQARIGTLEIGKAADLIVVDVAAINTITNGRHVESLVAHAHPGNVDTVMIAGQVLKRDGKLTQLNRGRLLGLLSQSWERHPVSAGVGARSS